MNREQRRSAGEMSDKDRFALMLTLASITNWSQRQWAGEVVLLQTAPNTITEFAFDAAGKLTGVSSYPGVLD